MTEIDDVTIACRRLGPEDVLAGVDLYSESSTLGPSQQRRLVREGGVSFGRAVLYRLTLDDFPALVHRRPDVLRRRFVVVELPFDLDDVGGTRRYIEATYTVTLDDPDAVAHSLWPISVNTPVEVERSRRFGVSADLSLGSMVGAPSAALEWGKVFRYDELHPVISSGGGGMQKFWWKFQEQEGLPLIPHGRRVFAVLDLPKDTPAILGSLTAEAVVSRHVAGVFKRVQAKTGNVDLHIPLTEGNAVLPAER